MLNLSAFIQATRPRTYPLAMAGILTGNATAYTLLQQQHIGWSAQHWQVFVLSLWVALALQILSNLANDYGDGIKGTDRHRLDRQTAQGTIAPIFLKKIIISWAMFTFCCGVGLLSLSFDNLKAFLIFLAFGILAIMGAMAYTMGKNPYGYRAKGELAVFVFFGLLSVCGSQYLQIQQVSWLTLAMAIVIGLLCTCVLMVNNMRDIDEDKVAGKITLAVILGKQKASQLYRVFFVLAMVILAGMGWYQHNFLLIFLPLTISVFAYPHLKTIGNYAKKPMPPNQLAGELKTIVLLTLTTSIIYNLSQIFG